MARLIQLTRGLETVVDDEDYGYLRNFRWHASGNGKRLYATRRGQSGEPKAVLMHRVITKAPDGFDVDHINGDTLDNRRLNLRVCTRSMNIGNGQLRKNNKTGIQGVSWDKAKRKFHAQIKINRKTKHLGFFTSATEARQAYERAARAAGFKVV